MADHVRLLRDLTLAAQGKPILSKPTLGFGGSYNYGKMRIAAAYAHALLTGNKQLALDARAMWLANEEEQLKLGAWCHAEQCEQLCPQPHSEFILAAEALMWREGLKQGDAELIAAGEATFGRSIAVWRKCSLGGIVCCPGGRAKDPDDKSNDAGVGQWRNRPGDAILARVVTGKRGVKFNGLSVQLFEECMKYGKPADVVGRVRSLKNSPLPRLRVPIHSLALPAGGYIAWHEPTEEARRALGKDALSGVVHRVKGKPEVYWDWAEIPGLEEMKRQGKIEIIGGA